jgi:hypothetical protein
MFCLAVGVLVAVEPSKRIVERRGEMVLEPTTLT